MVNRRWYQRTGRNESRTPRRPTQKPPSATPRSKNLENYPSHEMSYQRSITLLYRVTRAQESAPCFVHMFERYLGSDRPVIHSRSVNVATGGLVALRCCLRNPISRRYEHRVHRQLAHNTMC